MFLLGERVKVESFRKFSDYNVYRDNKLIRIYFVNRYKSASDLDVLAGCLMEKFPRDEKEMIEEIVDFINSFPNFWDYRNEEEYKHFNK